MRNIASVLKAEIARVARKELKAATDGHKKLAGAQRSEIADLKRRVRELEKGLKAFARVAKHGNRLQTSPGPAVNGEGDADGLRFRADGVASNRKRLGTFSR